MQEPLLSWYSLALQSQFFRRQVPKVKVLYNDTQWITNTWTCSISRTRRKGRGRLKYARYSTTIYMLLYEYIKAWTALTGASRKDWTMYASFVQHNQGVSCSNTRYSVRVLVGIWRYTMGILCTCTSCWIVRVRTNAICCQILPPSMIRWSYIIVLLTLILSPRGVPDLQAPCEDIPLGRHARSDYCTRSLQRWEFPKVNLTPALFINV